MFINISIYPPECGYEQEKLEAIKPFGKKVDLVAPRVNDDASPLEVWDIAKGLLKSVWDLQRYHSLPCTMICLDGLEATLTYAAVKLFLEHGLKVCRTVMSFDDGIKFVRFREFINHDIYEIASVSEMPLDYNHIMMEAREYHRSKGDKWKNCF